MTNLRSSPVVVEVSSISSAFGLACCLVASEVDFSAHKSFSDLSLLLTSDDIPGSDGVGK